MTRLNANYLLGVLSPGRHVRTRLYFTSGILWPCLTSFAPDDPSRSPFYPFWPLSDSNGYFWFSWTLSGLFLRYNVSFVWAIHNPYDRTLFDLVNPIWALINPAHPTLPMFDLYLTRVTPLTSSWPFWSQFDPDDFFRPCWPFLTSFCPWPFLTQTTRYDLFGPADFNDLCLTFFDTNGPYPP